MRRRRLRARRLCHCDVLGNCRRQRSRVGALHARGHLAALRARVHAIKIFAAHPLLRTGCTCYKCTYCLVEQELATGAYGGGLNINARCNLAAQTALFICSLIEGVWTCSSTTQELCSTTNKMLQWALIAQAWYADAHGLLG